MSRDVVGPAVAGSWYPASASELERDVDVLLEQSAADSTGYSTTEQPPLAGDVSALIAPHAGFAYSGAVAASAFRALREPRDHAIERVIMIGPSHYQQFDGCALPDAAAYRTPLGDVPLDESATRELRDLPGFRIDSAPFAPEHSLESELPFLQRVLPDGFTVVPLLVGAGTTAETLDAVTTGLAPLLGPETLIVVSSDFTHYGERFGYVPFEGHVEARVRELDMRAIDHIVALDRGGFRDFVGRTYVTICGRDAIKVLLGLLPEGSRGHLTDYDMSGRQTNDWDNTVSYAGVVFAPAPEVPAPS